MSEPTLVCCGCGGEVRFESYFSDDDGLRAECSRCHVSTGVYFVTDYRGTPKEKAASDWNRAMSLDRLRDRYTIPPDMAVLDWLDQAARAWEELAEQRTCDRCTKLAALVYDAYIEGWDECEIKTAEGDTTTCPSMEWEYSTARDDRCKIIGEDEPIDAPTDEPIRHLSVEAIVADLRRLGTKYLEQGRPELCAVCDYAARTYDRGELMRREP